MRSRRPEQSSMLALMGRPDLETKPPFWAAKISGYREDQDGRVLEVTTVGDKCPAYPESEDSDPWWDQPAPEERE